jgi:prophage DNA circulation protein
MAWQDGYLQASFRGVEFFIDSATEQGGRRLSEDELPERDDSYFQDMGRKNRVFSLSGYVVGDEYYSARDDLVTALEKEGTGTLVHPYRGDLEVRCLNFSTNERTPEGRMCRFDITFKWIKDEALFIISPDLGRDLLEKKRSFLDVLNEAFADAYEVASKPASVLQDAIDAVNDGLDTVENAKQVVGAYDEFQRKLSTLRGKVVEITLQADSLSSKLAEIIDFGTDPTVPIDDAIASADLIATSAATSTSEILSSGTNGREQYTELGNIVGFDEEDITAYPSLLDDDPDYPVKLIQELISRQTLGSRVGLIIGMDIASVQEADDVLVDLNTQVEKIENDDNTGIGVKSAARDLRSAVEKVIQDRKLTLNELNSLDLPEWEPGLVTSYDLYEDNERVAEIADLNDVVHPAFMPGERLTVYAN